MSDRVTCAKCGASILAATAARTGGVCIPCKRGTREAVERAKRRNLERQATLARLAADPGLRPWLSDPVRDAPSPRPLAPIRPAALAFVPFEGLLPFRFGMGPAEVEALAAAVPRRALSWDLQSPNDDYSNLRVGYTLDLLAEEFSVWPAGLTVTFEHEVILGPGATMDPLSAFLRVDRNPREELGFVIFSGLGVAVTGYHDGQPSQRAINFGARGVWDEHFSQAKPIDLSGYLSAIPWTTPQALIRPIRRLVELLVQERYQDIERMTGGQRLAADEMKRAVADYGRKLTMPPAEAWANLNVVAVEGAAPATYSVRFDLWAAGKPSDLSLLATLVEAPAQKHQLSLDDIRVR